MTENRKWFVFDGGIYINSADLSAEGYPSDYLYCADSFTEAWDWATEYLYPGGYPDGTGSDDPGYDVPSDEYYERFGRPPLPNEH